ncbi:ABC-type iron transport system FetAB ATPase subunit [Desulfobotulus alkaliphilus]|uniref:ABC-type iron transport system FetAB ATPase subunit n=1 Tax=Desulfobotulus alkaliphilus TaxID=622671 RepID=A0A562RTS1_9BACT|nr:ABC transporter ATP-binding protein [Desulfobotulus alkaliphilus]TWI72472.1 ABC-type iron transport system FetAB ATPase subunit [Desulfobotulus alkaliphilus]
MFSARNIRIHHIGPLSLSLRAGECAGISGPSGAGKSILMRAFADMEPFSGDLFLKDTPHHRFSGPEWRKKVALMPAESQWWFHTAGEHFPSGFPEENAAALGFSPDVGNWEIHRLSSGERQRLALLRILIHRPEVLLLDEPTANLDRRNTEAAENFILAYMEKTRAAVVWISHDPEQLRRVCHTLCKLEDGRLTGTGKVLY